MLLNHRKLTKIELNITEMKFNSKEVIYDYITNQKIILQLNISGT